MNTDDHIYNHEVAHINNNYKEMLTNGRTYDDVSSNTPSDDSGSQCGSESPLDSISSLSSTKSNSEENSTLEGVVMGLLRHIAGLTLSQEVELHRLLSNSETKMMNNLMRKGRPVPLNPFPVVVRKFGNSFTTGLETISVIGNEGMEEDNLCRPWGIACDKDGHIVVADRSNNRIQIWQENGTFVRRFGTLGTGPVQFDRPAGVAIDAEKRLIVVDKDNHRVQVLTMEGDFIFAFGEKGSKVGQFSYPWDCATNSQCQIVVSDTRNHRVQLFTSSGIFLRTYGSENVGNMYKNFDLPRSVAFNPEGNVVMTDFNNHRLVVISADFNSARTLEFGTEDASLALLRPQGIVVDDNGNLIVADSKNHRIQVRDAAGNLEWIFGSFGQGDGQMDRPSGIALTRTGRIAVVDFGNNRVLLI
ncbi:E3 ubiquitin-protein ligase TRIM71 isoform X2 [Fopius arisanus]|uniref:E3 ubiquitin-protein ligase TRIM71 isoform X2 n=1 Tax=Fopius arisanus TaxID=64838 RepID=A0A0C9RDL3_9HYME|nr:PREDICTED: E3 ubiquitin-protein ligase TRIM71 isoform X2 [Fopius arisanus]